MWWKGTVNLNVEQSFRIIFKATAGYSFGGGIALDDIRFHHCGPGKCQIQIWYSTATNTFQTIFFSVCPKILES